MPLWKIKTGWRYQFEHRGKRHSESGFRTKADAQAALVAKRRELTQISVLALRPMAFLELAVKYLEDAQRRFAEKTYKYKSYVFRSFLEHAGDLPLDQVTVPIIEAYLATRHSNVNYNRHRKDLCALLAWAWKRKYIPENPCFFIDQMPEDRQRPAIPTEEEMARILLAAGPERPFLLVLYHTLARVDEILRLRWDDINFSERTIRLWTRKRKDGSWAFDVLPMNEDLYQVLKGLWERHESPEWVFVNPTTGNRYMHRPKLMRGICKRAGVRHFGFHTIRHFVASLLADKEKVSMPTISRLLRHKSLRTTELYLQRVDQGLRDVMAKLENENLLNRPTQNKITS